MLRPGYGVSSLLRWPPSLTWRAACAASGVRRASYALALVFASILHLGLSPAFRTILAMRLRATAIAQGELAITATVGACADGGYLYLLTGSDPALALFTGPALELYAPQKAGAQRIRVLSLAPQAQRLRRVAPHTFDLEVVDSPRALNHYEALLRSPERPITPGERVSLEPRSCPSRSAIA